MSYENMSRPCWVVRCDVCGEAVGNDEGGTAHFKTKAEALERAKEEDWQYRDGKLACGGCIMHTDKSEWRDGKWRWIEPTPQPAEKPKP